MKCRNCILCVTNTPNFVHTTQNWLFIYNKLEYRNKNLTGISIIIKYDIYIHILLYNLVRVFTYSAWTLHFIRNKRFLLLISKARIYMPQRVFFSTSKCNSIQQCPRFVILWSKWCNFYLACFCIIYCPLFLHIIVWAYLFYVNPRNN